MDEPLVETELADSEPPRRRGPWKLIVIVALLTLIGVWLVPGERPEDVSKLTGRPAGTAPSLLGDGPTDVPAPTSATQGTAETASQGVAESATETAVETQPVDDRPGSRARALIAKMRADGDIRLDDVFGAAQQAQRDGQLADAYLLYFFAAREGHAAAALALGTQADPASRDPANSVFESADLNQAHKWYQIAAQHGDAEAQQRLADLRGRIEQLAASGDPQAQRISLLWQ